MGLPALDISLAFPQATPASVFPPSGKIDQHNLKKLRKLLCEELSVDVLLSLSHIYVILHSIAASDYYQSDDLLTPEEQALRRKIREVMEKEIAPVVTEVRIIVS